MNWPTTDADLIRQVILYNEGGYVNNPADKGGPTHYGITQDTLASWRGHPVTVDDVKNLPMAEAISIYEKRYIVDPNFILISDIKLRTALVDAAVLFGPQTVIKALQGILGVKADGVLGNDTAAAAGRLEARGLINSLSVWRVTRHASRVDADHSQIVFLKGWMARATSFIV
jgi:lysozyme family protein